MCSNTFLRFLHEDSTEKYFTCGENAVGKSSETTALLVPSEDAAFKPLVDLLKVCKINIIFSLSIKPLFLIQRQEVKDGVTTTGKPAVLPVANAEGKKCAKCTKIGEEMWVLTVRFFFKTFLTFSANIWYIFLIVL